MNFGVSGAGGNVGGKVVRDLIERAGDHQVVAISRSPQSAAGWETRKGDYDDPAGLVAAYQGIDRLVLIPSDDLRPGARGLQFKNAIDAAVQAGVGHIYLLSAAGVRHASAPELGEAYWTGEQYLIRTAPRWTILRMNYYAESMIDEILMAKDHGVLAGLGDDRVAYISRFDVASALAGALVGEGHAGAIYNLTGPAILTGADVAAAASETLGKSMTFTVLSEEQMSASLAQAGLPDGLVHVIIDIKKSFVRGDFDVLTTDVARLSGKTPKTLQEVLAEKLS